MNTVVTARVPVEIKSQVDQKLREIGSTPTQLINSAYEYVLKYGCLPQASHVTTKGKGEVKRLSPEEAKRMQSTWEKRAILDLPGYDGENFKELLDEARGEYFARFA